MGDVVHFSEASSIAMHAMAILAGRPERHVPIREVAERLPISDHHLAKVLQRLVRAGLVESVRGPAGGFRLLGDPAGVTLLQVYEAIEGPLDSPCCLMSPPQSCSHCILGGALHEARAVIRGRLGSTRLSEVMHSFTGVPGPATLGQPPRSTAARRKPRA